MKEYIPYMFLVLAFWEGYPALINGFAAILSAVFGKPNGVTGSAVITTGEFIALIPIKILWNVDMNKFVTKIRIFFRCGIYFIKIKAYYILRR